MSVRRSYQNVSAVNLEICEVGKPVKKRVVVPPGEISPLVHVTDEWHEYITVKTGFAIQMDEQEVEDVDIPEGYVEITEVGSTIKKFRPMTADERAKAGLEPLIHAAPAKPLPAVVVQGKLTTPAEPAPAEPTPVAPAAPVKPAKPTPATPSN
jgi:hypothetical protein